MSNRQHYRSLLSRLSAGAHGGGLQKTIVYVRFEDRLGRGRESEGSEADRDPGVNLRISGQAGSFPAQTLIADHQFQDEGGYHGRNSTEFSEAVRTHGGVGSPTFQYGCVL